MAKSINETNTIDNTESKWDKFAGGVLKDSETITFMIPKDKLNPVNHVWISLNGDECYLAKGKQITVPREIYDIYMNSYNGTIEAEQAINTDNELQA